MYVVSLPPTAYVRFRRDRVCTAVTPSRRLSTYIAHSSGWSNPVWYLLATMSTWKSSEPNAVGSVRPRNPLLRFHSEYGGSTPAKLTPGTCSAVMVPENATSVASGYRFAEM